MHSEFASLPEIVVVKEIVRNSCFVVYKAQYRSKFVILKAATHSDAMSEEMLRREYELGRTLAHPLIVNTLDFLIETPIGPAIVIEYIEGQTLDKYIAQNPPLAVRHRLVQDILEATAYLHRQAIFHNDLKDSNIIVNRNGAPRIIDFGLSLSDDSVYKGCFGGTRGSSAPELLDGNGDCCSNTDIYALGKLIDAIYEGRHMRKIVNRCIDKEPTRRYQSVSELQQAILWRRRRGIVVGVLAALVALVAALVMIVTPYINRAIESHERECRWERIEAAMRPFYEKACARATQEKLQEFAFIAKMGYYKCYDDFSSTLAAEDKSICEEIFARQVAVLDSIAFSKPTISSLPKGEREATIDLFNSIQIEL